MVVLTHGDTHPVHSMQLYAPACQKDNACAHRDTTKSLPTPRPAPNAALEADTTLDTACTIHYLPLSPSQMCNWYTASFAAARCTSLGAACTAGNEACYAMTGSHKEIAATQHYLAMASQPGPQHACLTGCPSLQHLSVYWGSRCFNPTRRLTHTSTHTQADMKSQLSPRTSLLIHWDA
jgi:hypothetical protein